MGNNAHRKKERREQKRKEKRKKQEQSRARQEQRGEIYVASNARHNEHMARQVPHAWQDELREDVAVFNNEVMSTLSPELAVQVTAVRQALLEVSQNRGSEALKSVSEIPRSSVMSEWRLYLRGLVDWLANQTEQAGEIWERLDPRRRPGRMAQVMMAALRTDLDQLSVPAPKPEPLAVPQSPSETFADTSAPHIEGPVVASADGFPLDNQQISNARLLRRVRFERPAFKLADAGLSVAEESNTLQIGPRKVQWLRRFISEHEKTEPALTAALAQGALRRAYSQPYSDLFQTCASQFQGPRHDRKNLLLTFHYYGSFEDDPFAERSAAAAFEAYLNQYLPTCGELSESVRGAIASWLHLVQAQAALQVRSPFRSRMPSFLDFSFGFVEDTKSIRKHLNAAIKAYPEHGAVYEEYANWVNSQLEDESLSSQECDKLEAELVELMLKWTKHIPDRVKPRLWLVDYYLENEQMDEARPHIDFLSSSRHDDPLVKALPWKWQLLEAMRLARRKAWLAEIPERLNAAEKLWPAWLTKQWLPYFRAALARRHGNVADYEQQRRQICEASGIAQDSLADACMMLSAAQLMRNSPADLKPMRAMFEQQLKKVSTLPLSDLVDIGSFFWDLERIQLFFPSYEKHGKVIGKVLFSRLEESRQFLIDRVDEPGLQKAVLWGSESRFWPAHRFQVRVPSFFTVPQLIKNPFFKAARIHSFLKGAHLGNGATCWQLSSELRSCAQTQADTYYRFWFNRLCDDLDQLKHQPGMRSPFAELFGWSDDDDSVDDGDDDAETGDLSNGGQSGQPFKGSHEKSSSARS